jgi:hypothetical protein
MALSDWFRNLITTRTQDFTLLPIGPTSGGLPSRQIVPNEEYVTLVARSWRVAHVRRWTSTFSGCVHARTVYLHEAAGIADCSIVVAPQMLRDLDPANVDHVISLNKVLAGPLPLRGDVSLELGLFSVKGSDLAGPFVDVLTLLAETAGVASVASALPLGGSLRRGAELLFGNSDQAHLEIGMDQTFRPVTTGTWVLARVPKGAIGESSIRLDPQDSKLLDANAKPVSAFPYLVFSVEASRERSDWMLIPQLKAAWEAIGVAAMRRQLDRAEALLEEFAVLAEWSPDLLPADARQLADRARAKLPQLQRRAAVSVSDTALAAHPLGDLSELALYS